MDEVPEHPYGCLAASCNISTKEIGKPVTFEDVLAAKGYLVYSSVGRSMLPLLRERRDIIEIRAKGPSRCKKYDVVLYKRGETYILHRILKVLPRGYIIAGDHNAFLERDITDAQILGVMTRVIRDGKTVTPDSFLYKCYVRLWCAPYPVRFFILRCVWKLRAVLRRIRDALRRRAGSDENREPQ